MSNVRIAPLLLTMVLVLALPATVFALSPRETSTKTGITLTAPNGGEKWELGVTNSVTWTPYSYNPDVNPSKDVSAYLERKNSNGTYTTLGRVEESGKASIHWITGDLNSQNGTFSQVSPGSYYVRIVNNKTGVTDRSDAPFTILTRPVDVKVNGSDGPIKLINNQKVRVSWSSTGGRNNCELSGVRKTKNGNNYIENLSASGSMDVYAAVISDYSSNVVGVSCHKGDDGSTTVYDVVAVTAGTTPVAASVKVVSPNGGEKIDPTKQMNVQFTPVGIKSYSLALYKNDQFKYWITKDQVAAGERTTQGWFPGKVLEGLGEGDNAGAIFKIYVTAQKADGTGYVDDKSDASFSFVPPVATAITATYRAYLNGQLSITTEDMTKPDALSNCKKNSANNPSASIRCTWGSVEIYKYSPTTSPLVPTITLVYSTPGTSAAIATLTWATSNATRCYLKYNSTQIEVPLNGAKTVYPERTTTYTLRCGNEQNGKDGPVTERSVTVPVQSADAPPTCTLTTAKKVYAVGEEVTFTWTSTGATYGAWVLNADAKALKLSGDKLNDYDTLTTTMASTSSRLIVTLNVFSKTGEKGYCRVQLSNPPTAATETDRAPLTASAYAAVAKQLEDLLAQLRALQGR